MSRASPRISYPDTLACDDPAVPFNLVSGKTLPYQTVITYHLPHGDIEVRHKGAYLEMRCSWQRSMGWLAVNRPGRNAGMRDAGGAYTMNEPRYRIRITIEVAVEEEWEEVFESSDTESREGVLAVLRSTAACIEYHDIPLSNEEP